MTLRLRVRTALLLWTAAQVVLTSFVGEATAVPAESLPIAQTEQSATTSEQDRCPFQQTRFRMEDLWVEDVTLDYQGQALRIRIRGSTDELSIAGFDPRVPYRELGRFQFEDGSVCTADLVDRGFDLAGTEEAEIVLGTNAADRIRGKQGNDTLDGAEGDDIYYFDSGDGVDCIQDFSGRTTLAFGAGIAAQDIMIAEGGSAEERTLFVRIMPQGGARASQGLDVRTDSRAQPLSPDFQFTDGSTFTLRELQRVASRAGLDPQALALERVCYFDTQTAARAGWPNKRASSPQLPPMPVPKVVPPHNPNTIMVPGSDGRLRLSPLRLCLVDAGRIFLIVL